jgi:hypothetical protein
MNGDCTCNPEVKLVSQRKHPSTKTELETDLRLVGVLAFVVERDLDGGLESIYETVSDKIYE